MHHRDAYVEEREDEEQTRKAAGTLLLGEARLCGCLPETPHLRATPCPVNDKSVRHRARIRNRGRTALILVFHELFNSMHGLR